MYRDAPDNHIYCTYVSNLYSIITQYFCTNKPLFHRVMNHIYRGKGKCRPGTLTFMSIHLKQGSVNYLAFQYGRKFLCQPIRSQVDVCAA